MNGTHALTLSAARWQLKTAVIETVCTCVVLAFLFWQSAPFREGAFGRGAGDRYQQALELKVQIPAVAAGTDRVAGICERFGEALSEAEREALGGACTFPRPTATNTSPAELGALLPALTEAYQALIESFDVPLRTNRAALAQLENRAREARTEIDVRGAAENLASETRRYREAYGIDGDKAGSRSIPLDCAWKYLDRRYRSLAERDASSQDRVRVVIVMASIIDGAPHQALAGASFLERGAGAKWNRAENDLGCAAAGSPSDVIKQAAEIVARARVSESNAGKSIAMERLIVNAQWYLGVWAILALVLLKVARHAVYAHRFIPLALLLWGIAAWFTHVPLHSVIEKHVPWLLHWWNPWSVAAAGSLGILAWLLLRRWSLSAPRVGQAASSGLAYPGFVLFTGTGWFLLLDLSVTGRPQMRFLALEQQLYIFAAFVLLTLLPILRIGFARLSGRYFAALLLLARPAGSGLRRYAPWLIYAAPAAFVLLAVLIFLQDYRQFTSEVFRIWFIVGTAWFFFWRGEAGVTRLRGIKKAPLEVFLFYLPLLFVFGVGAVGLLLTDDSGPLLVMLYATSVFVGAAVALLLDRAGYRRWLSGTIGVVVAACWIYGVTSLLFTVPYSDRVAERLASMRNPFIASNDQLAMVTWFQESAPAHGYGFTAVPWCSDLAASACRGVPNQIQSDYIFTALVGVYGMNGALLAVALIACWLVRLVINHDDFTDGTVTFDSPVSAQQSWLSWISLCWVGLTLAQLAITVAGNLGWLPLTGIAFPFVSFGCWSLLVNTFFLGIAMTVPRASK
jgi:cell division protein FtsW (lipid II flippase)